MSVDYKIKDINLSDLGRKKITGKQNNVSVSKLNENNPIGFKI